MRRVGIMQGRLLPPVSNRIQAFPGPRWEEEFASAATLGLATIEWVLESPLETNPLWTESGCRRIRKVVEKTGVTVEFICADYFMESPFVRMALADRERNQSVLRHLIGQAASLGLIGIEIPMVDSSRIESVAEEEELIAALRPCLDAAAENGIQIGLETSLGPERFRGLLERFDHPAIRANYDTGNSASLGYEPAEEIGAYGKWINNIHIKDRKRGGGTVPLGTGSADIPRVLRLLQNLPYSGAFILQAARGSEESETARGYLEQFRRLEAGLDSVANEYSV